MFFRRKLGIINKFIPISAGMWGGKPDKNGNPPLPKIKEQMEKYKVSNMSKAIFSTQKKTTNKETQTHQTLPLLTEPKKSPFAMSIVRGEIPKPLDLEEILEKIVNPAHHFT